ncbi:hypothetical protein RFF05_06150 [Bengtsoniella intestinalis]|uniref:hypothetical protein n=1 Tax=Bengtsoniella intestinalis TaxID=3073143 RepID=UPI00391F32C3
MSCNCNGGCCGGHDESKETQGCGCGGHDHAHGEGCGCGGHEEATPMYTYNQEPLSDAQKTFLQQMAQCCYLPVARYVVKSSKESDFQMGAFGPAFIQGDHHSRMELEQVRLFLTELEHLGLLSLDYDIPLDGYDYGIYGESEVFTQLKEAVADSQGKAGFLGDIATYEEGSMALTEAAMDLLGNWL